MFCDRCHAGQMQEYEKKIGKSTLRGKICGFCGFVVLDNDDEIWSALKP